MKSYNNTFIYDKSLPEYYRKTIKTGIYIFDIWWSLLLTISRLKRKKENKKYYISICAIFKDEGLSLKEWIEYHLIIGVEHFYLYNNFSSDNYSDILQPYIDKNIITLTDWPIASPSQVKAYQHFHDNFWSETQWVAFIDIDEYICPKYHDNLKEFLIQYQTYPSIVIYWKQFGSSENIQHDDSKLITEQYIIAWEKFYDYGKTIFNTSFEVYEFSSKYIHELCAKTSIFSHKMLIPPINEFKYFVHFRCNRIGCFNDIKDFTIQINHYFTKSYTDFFVTKRKRGTATSTGTNSKHIRSILAYNFVQKNAIVSDYTIFRFIIKLKTKMNKNIKNYFEE